MIQEFENSLVWINFALPFDLMVSFLSKIFPQLCKIDKKEKLGEGETYVFASDRVM